jgi:hypothetical protein
VDGLEVPGDLSRLPAQGDDGAAVVAHPAALAAVVVRGRVAGRDEDEAASLVHRHRRPDVRCSERVAGLTGGADLGIEARRRQVPRPAQLARASVEAPHDATRCVDAGVVAHRRPHDHDVSDDGGRRGHLVFALPALGPGTRVEIDLPLPAEAGAGCSGGCVQGDQARVVGTGEEGASAERVGASDGIEPGRDAATDELVRVATGEIDLRVEDPTLGAAGRLESDDAIEGRAQIEQIVHEDRRVLEGGRALNLAPAIGDVAMPVGPGGAQRADVLPREGVEGRVPRTPLVAPVGGPLADAGDTGLRQGRGTAGQRGAAVEGEVDPG